MKYIIIIDKMQDICYICYITEKGVEDGVE